jgi:replicative DNA helicase
MSTQEKGNMSNFLNDTDLKPDTALPFSKKKQSAILGHCLIEPKFFLQARNLIQPNWFADSQASKVFTAMLAWFEHHGRPGTLEEILHGPEITSEEAALRPKLVNTIHSAVNDTNDFRLDALTVELTKWLQSRLFYTGVHTSQKSYNTGRLEDAYLQMEKVMKGIREATFLNEREESFGKWRSDFELAQFESQRGLTFGLSAVDDLLLPGNRAGSLLPGDTTIMLAPTNVGKTTAMITTLVANLMMGKRVLFITHEGRPLDIKQKIWMSYMNKTARELFDLPKTDEGIAELDKASTLLNRFLTYVPYNKAGLSVEDVEPLIRRKQEDLAARNNGKGYDLLVCDYPAKLTTKLANGGHMSKRNVDEIVYGYFVQLALEYGFHNLLAIQTNREGSKVNKGQKDEHRLLVMEDVHESYGVMQEATNVITLNRDPVAKARQHMTFHIDKSRSSETGFAVVARTDFGRARTHHNDLGAIWYRGVATMADQVDDLLRNPELNGKEIDITQFV